MKKCISLTLAILLTLYSTNSAAQDSLILPVKEGATVPFEGLLLNPPAVAKIISDKNFEPERTKLEVDKVVSQLTADCKFQLKRANLDCDERVALLNAQISERDSHVQSLDKQLKDTDEKLKIALNSQKMVPYYTAGSFLLGAVFTVLTTYAVVKTTQ